MINLMHVITGLNMGGAEVMLNKTVAFADRSDFNIFVISMLPEGPMSEKIKALGVPVRSLGMSKGLPSPAVIFTLRRYLRELRIDVVQTWMYHANLLGGIAAKLARVPCVWGIHHSNLSPHVNRKRTVAVAKICGPLSRSLPARIVCCAEKSLELHASIGYERDKMIVIPNGFDLRDFHPDVEARADFRRELNISDDTFLIGMVGRYDPQKDHENFLWAAKYFTEAGRDAHFVLCGDGMMWENAALVEKIPRLVKERIHLLGRRGDIPRIDAALDLATLSSSDGEAFPNVVGEAMACEVPCVVTDVGDTAMMVGDTGIVVQPRDAQALARGWSGIYDMEADVRIILGKRARTRIFENFEIADVVGRYEDVYRGVLSAPRNASKR